jgi:hypothetical protein
VASLPVAGTHYPRSAREFCCWFSTDDDCLDYFDWIRWANGSVCGQCDSEGTGWPLADRRIMCAECGARTSVTAGTIFDRTPRPLTVRFHAVWLFSIQKAGGSAKPLRRALGMNSYQTTWTMLHRLCSSLIGPGRERLVGIVEVDEAYFGGVRPGKPGTADDGRLLVGVAVEQLLRQRGARINGPHRWLLGNHQGAEHRNHLQAYLDEFVFRFNRRTSRSRDKVFFRVLELAIDHEPVWAAQFVMNPKPKATPPKPPWQKGRTLPLEAPRALHPWRGADLGRSGYLDTPAVPV